MTPNDQTQSNESNELGQIIRRFDEEADIEFLKSKGIEVEIYFDTYYILAMIQGYWDINTSSYKGVDRDTFKDDRFLVKGFAYFNYLKNIRILLPHLSELHNQLDKTYLLPSDPVEPDEINEFLKSTHLDTLDELSTVIKNEGLEIYLNRLSSYAVNIFKANYVLSELNWTQRFKYLFDKKNPVISYDDINYSTSEILDSPLFHRVLNALSSGERIKKTVNNLRDAMSICMLKFKLNKFEKDHKNLPLLYLTSDVLSKMDSSLKKEFTVSYKGYTINALKDTEYFIVNAMFSASNNLKDKRFIERFRKLKETIKIYKSIGEQLPANQTYSLINEWNQYKDHDFFETIWHDEVAGRVKLNSILLSLIQYDKLIENDEAFKKAIDTEKDKIKRNIIDRVSDLVFLEDVWKEIDTFGAFLKEYINDKSILIQNEEADIFRDGGLTRFSPPAGDVEEQIKELWNGFLEHRQNVESDECRRLKVRLTKLIYEGVLKNKDKKYDKVLIGLCILWMFRKYSLIIKIVERLENQFGDRYQIPLIYMASILRLPSRSTSQLTKIDNMIECVKSKKCYVENYKAWLGLGYLNFNIWSRYSSAPLIPELSSLNLLDKKLEKYYQEGIRLTKAVYDYLRVVKDADENKEMYRNVKYFYALNNYIYYVVRTGSSQQFDNEIFKHLVRELEEIQSEDRYKQARFSDTIAYYFYRKALLAESLESKDDFLGSATDHIQDAIKFSVVIDKKFDSLQNLIRIYKDDVTKLRNAQKLLNT